VGLVEEGEVAVDAAEDREHARLYGGLGREFVPDANGAEVDDGADTHGVEPSGGLAGRVGRAEEVVEESGDLEGDVAFLSCVPRLPERRAEAGDEGECDEGGGRDASAVPAYEPRGAVSEAGRPGADGQAVEIATEVVCQVRGRGVSPVRVFLGRGQDDGVEVAPELAAEGERRRGAGASDVLGV